MRTLAIIGFCILLNVGIYSPGCAEELFDEAAATIHLEKGIEYLQSKDFNSAISELEESVSIAPAADAFYYLGYAYYLKGRSGDSESRKKSIESFDKAYELDPLFTPNRFTPDAFGTLETKAESHETAIESDASQNSIENPVP